MCVCLIVKCSLIEQEEEYGVDHSVNNKWMMYKAFHPLNFGETSYLLTIVY